MLLRSKNEIPTTVNRQLTTKLPFSQEKLQFSELKFQENTFKISLNHKIETTKKYYI